MIDFNLYLILPVVILASYGLLVLLLAPAFPARSRILGLIALAGIGIAGFALWRLWELWRQAGQPIWTGRGMVRIDGLGLFVSFILLAVAGLTVLASTDFLERERADHGEFYALVLIAAAGMIVLALTTHLLVVLVGLEVFSMSLYVLTGLTRTRVRSVEAALKYFLLGAFSSGFLVYGLALLYGASGSLELGGIKAAASSAPSSMFWIGMGLVFVGFAFKIGAVPFHQWIPDVYEGAPTNVTGFMAAATKTAVFVALLRLLLGAFSAQAPMWTPLVTWMAVLTMTVANLVALSQNNIKRMLAFSSIAHAGYLFIALVCNPKDGVPAILFYLTAYAFMTVGVFAIAGWVGRGDATSESGYDVASWAGLGRSRPVLATAMTVFLLSLAGMPPTGGFLGKYLIFQAAIRSQQYMLAVVGVVNAVIAAY